MKNLQVLNLGPLTMLLGSHKLITGWLLMHTSTLVQMYRVDRTLSLNQITWCLNAKLKF